MRPGLAPGPQSHPKGVLRAKTPLSSASLRGSGKLPGHPASLPECCISLQVPGEMRGAAPGAGRDGRFLTKSPGSLGSHSAAAATRCYPHPLHTPGRFSGQRRAVSDRGESAGGWGGESPASQDRVVRVSEPARRRPAAHDSWAAASSLSARPTRPLAQMSTARDSLRSHWPAAAA